MSGTMGSKWLQEEIILDATSPEGPAPLRPSTRHWRVWAAVLVVIGVALLVINFAAPLRPGPSELAFWSTNFERPYVHHANVRIEILATELRGRRGGVVANPTEVRSNCRGVASELAQLHGLSTPSPAQVEVDWLRLTGDDASLWSLECHQVAAPSSASLRARIARAQEATAAASGAFDAFLRHRGAHVLALSV